MNPNMNPNFYTGLNEADFMVAVFLAVAAILMVTGLGIMFFQALGWVGDKLAAWEKNREWKKMRTTLDRACPVTFKAR